MPHAPERQAFQVHLHELSVAQRDFLLLAQGIFELSTSGMSAQNMRLLIRRRAETLKNLTNSVLEDLSLSDEEVQ